MKDMYELFNDVNIDLEDYEEMEVTELERKKVKNNLKKLTKKKKRNWRKNTLAAAAALVISTTVLGATFPAYAQNIPIVGNIFQAIDETLFANFQAFSDELGMTQTSNGISITVNDAVFDGETVFFTYSIKSDRDLGADIGLTGFPDVKGANGGGGGSNTEKLDEHNYIGLMTVTSHFEKEQAKARVKWNVGSIITENGEIDGDWSFAFSLGVIESEEIPVNKTIEEEGVEVTVNKIAITPISFNVFFEQKASAAIVEQWDDMTVELSIKDDLGNEYGSMVGGGSGTWEYYQMAWLQTFEKINPNATKLIITPEVYLRNHNAQNHGGVVIEDTQEETDGNTATTSVTVEVGGDADIEIESETRVLEDIIVELR